MVLESQPRQYISLPCPFKITEKEKEKKGAKKKEKEEEKQEGNASEIK